MVEILSLIESFASHINVGGDIQECIVLVNNLSALVVALEKDVAAVVAPTPPVTPNYNQAS
jgi:hypothetical protein